MNEDQEAAMVQDLNRQVDAMIERNRANPPSPDDEMPVIVALAESVQGWMLQNLLETGGEFEAPLATAATLGLIYGLKLGTLDSEVAQQALDEFRAQAPDVFDGIFTSGPVKMELVADGDEKPRWVRELEDALEDPPIDQQ